MTTKRKDEIVCNLIDYFEEHMYNTICDHAIDYDEENMHNAVTEIQIELLQKMLNTLK